MCRFTLVSRCSKLLAPLLLLAAASTANAANFYVGLPGIDNPYYGTTPDSPFSTIQFAIDQASSGDTILVLADTYTGAGNKDLDFGGKNLTLEALPYYGTATMVTIDCQDSGRAFYFHNGETPAAIVEKFNVIHGNEGSSYGGGAYIHNSSPTFIDCTFAFNKAYSGAGIYSSYASPTYTGTTFTTNSGGVGGAVYQDSFCYPLYTHCKFTNNKVDYYGGAVYMTDGNALFNNDTFTGNTAEYGGALFSFSNTYPTFSGGTISGNKALIYGGACYNEDHSSQSFYNTVITGNSAQSGGAFYNYSSSSPFIYSATITGNKATAAGGAFYNDSGSSPSIYFSILWNNKVGLSDSEIVDTDATSVTYLRTTDIQGGWNGSSDGGTSNVDPKFVSTTDFHLQAISPLIDAGYYLGWSYADHDGNPRVCNLISDLGAYERALPTANDDANYSMSANTTLTVSKAFGVLANDLANKGGTLSAALVTKPVYGTLTLKADGSFTYKATAGFTGTQYFAYKAKNSKGSSSLAYALITIS